MATTIPRPAIVTMLLATAMSCAAEPPPPPPAPPPPPPIVAPPATVAEAPALAVEPPALAVEPPAPTAEPSAVPQAPRGPLPKIDPEALKTYRVEICYFGGFSLRLARDAYLAGLGKNGPGKGRLPGFFDVTASARLPYERDARSCHAAVALRDPDFGDVDPAVAAYALLAKDLSKALTLAQSYYATKEYEADGFTRGGWLHEQLVDGFKRLDALHDRLGAAVTARRLARPPRVTDEGERLARTAVDQARELLGLALAIRFDAKAFASSLAKLGAAVDALAARGTAEPGNAWPKILSAPLGAFRHDAAGLRLTAPQKVEAADLNALAHSFLTLIEARQRAIARTALTARTP